MDEKQILKEIAYYSKVIDSHKKRTENAQNGYYKPYNANFSTKTNPKTYYPRTYNPNVKTSTKLYNTSTKSYNASANSYKTNTNSYNTSTKSFSTSKGVYNMNVQTFKTSVNMNKINGNSMDKYKFVKKPPTVIPDQEKGTKVLINPNFKRIVHINPNFNKTISTQQLHINPKVIKMSKETQPKVTMIKSNLSPLAVKPNLTNKFVINKTPVRKRRISIRSKYKIVKSNTKTPQSSPIIKNKYKIDHRTKSTRLKSLVKKRLIRKSLGDSLRNSLFTNKTWRRTSLKTDQFKVDNLKNRPKTRTENSKKKCLISLRGQKYVMDSSKKTLKLISTTKSVAAAKKISVKGVTYIQKSSYTYVKSNTSNQSNSRTRRSGLRGNEVSSFRKNNIPCPVYHRFGKCRRKDAGRCVFKHNPDQIALCKKFLQGACISEDCLLSHKVSLEKMPTCKYYLEGCCIRTGCPYLHVKISPNAEICRNFLEGFCRDAVKCEKRHQYLCPDFERSGTCPKRKCRYPHKTKGPKAKAKPCVAKERPKVEEKPTEKDLPREKFDAESARYYVDKKAGPAKVSDVKDIEGNEDAYKRVKLGILPAFIPLD